MTPMLCFGNQLTAYAVLQIHHHPTHTADLVFFFAWGRPTRVLMSTATPRVQKRIMTVFPPNFLTHFCTSIQVLLHPIVFQLPLPQRHSYSISILPAKFLLLRSCRGPRFVPPHVGYRTIKATRNHYVQPWRLNFTLTVCFSISIMRHKHKT
jgi:hypothetical protein